MGEGLCRTTKVVLKDSIAQMKIPDPLVVYEASMTISRDEGGDQRQTNRHSSV